MIRLIPRETKFFRLFAEVSQNLTEGARLLYDILKSPANMGERLDRLQEIEHRGDDMTHSIITTLNQTFITPFDREDIHRLTSSLDDVLDFVNSVGSWSYWLYRPVKLSRSKSANFTNDD